MFFGSRGQRSVAKRFPLVVMLSCGMLSVVLRIAMRLDGLTGQIARAAVLGFAVISIVAAIFLLIRFRVNGRRIDDRIDKLLADRARPNIRYHHDR